MSDIKDAVTKIKLEAQNEIREEIQETYKETIKHVIRKLENAKIIVKNLERELEDLYAQISERFDDTSKSAA